jgi:hypothetical protein
MLLDALNTPFSDQAYAHRQMLALVKEQFKPNDRMAVFTLTGPLNLLQDFTVDPQPGQLRLAVQDVRTGMVGTIKAATP